MSVLGNKTQRIALLILITTACFIAGHGQSSTFQVRGQILDWDRAVVVGAEVIIRGNTARAPIRLLTNENGEFSTALPSGTYTVEVSANGFAKREQKLSIDSIDPAPLDIALSLAEVESFVTVSGGGEYGLDTTTSATKTPTALRNIPQSISIVTGRQVSDQSMTSIGDVVRYIPGISAHQGENNRDQVVIRGQSSSADFFIDGVRDDVQYYRDLYNLDRLESLKGPSAMTFGRGGGGGVINRVTKEAEFVPFAEFNLQGGSFGGKRVATDLDRPLTKRLAFRLNGVYENSGSFRKFVGLKRLAFNPKITFNADGNTRLTFGYEFLRDRRVADRGITSFQGRPADVSVSTYYGNPDDGRVRANVNLVTASLERQFGSLTLRNRAQYGDYDRFYQNYVPGAVNSARTLVSVSAYNNATRRRNLFDQTDLIYLVSTGSIRHTVLGGAEFGRQLTGNFRNTGFFNNSTMIFQVPFADPTTHEPVTFRQSPTDADNKLKLLLGAVYVQDQAELNRHFQVIAGVRFDYFDLRYHNNRNLDNIRRIDRLVSPRFGAVLTPVDALSIYGSYSVSYLPSSGDQFSSLSAVTQQVKPEKFQNLEAGVKWEIRRGLSFTSSVYRLDRTNTRSTDPNNPTLIIQTGSQRSNGMEVALNGSITPKWSFTGGYAYQNAFITSATTAAVAGKQVGQVPHHSFSLWNKYQLLSKLSLGLGIIRRTDSFAGVDNTVILPGYTRADGAVFYTFNEHWKLQGNIENLFDTQYFLNADSNTNISPGSPRSVKIGLVARF